MSATSTPAGSVAPGEPARDLDPEPVVGEEDVADARDEHPSGTPVHGDHLDLVGVEVPEPAVRDLQLRGRVAVDGDRDVHLAVDVVQHRLRPWPAGRRGSRSWASPPGPRTAAAPGCPWRPACRRRGRRRSRDRRRRRRRGPTTARPSRTPASSGAPRMRRGRRRRAGAQGADRAVQALPDLGRHRVHGVDDRGRARVRRPGLRLLLVGEHQRAQAEDLVDLGAVEQVRRALGGELRVVGEDDRRREQQVGALGRPGEHGPGVPVVQLTGRGQRPLGRVGGREERARADGQQGVRGDQRRPQGRPRGRRRRGRRSR